MVICAVSTSFLQSCALCYDCKITYFVQLFVQQKLTLSESIKIFFYCNVIHFSVKVIYLKVIYFLMHLDFLFLSHVFYSVSISALSVIDFTICSFGIQCFNWICRCHIFSSYSIFNLQVVISHTEESFGECLQKISVAVFLLNLFADLISVSTYF